ncbi:MAG: hypothetical protein L6V93_17485 [Clostridiales bacterium]|nr:MAG: hypothetical protein L6V93_17485 [Clostridiales bacterium]
MTEPKKPPRRKMMKQVTDAQTAQIIKDNMKSAVERGTGGGAAIAGKNICGKKQAPPKTKKPPKTKTSPIRGSRLSRRTKNPEVCVTVLLAYSGSSSLASSAARQVYSAYYNIFLNKGMIKK